MKMTKRNILVLSLSLVLIGAVTFSVRWIRYIDMAAFRILAQVVLNLLNGLIAWVAMKCTGMKPELDFQNKRQYGIGVAIALVLGVGIAVVPALCGFSLVGNHTDFSLRGGGAYTSSRPPALPLCRYVHRRDTESPLPLRLCRTLHLPRHR